MEINSEKWKNGRGQIMGEIGTIGMRKRKRPGGGLKYKHVSETESMNENENEKSVRKRKRECTVTSTPVLPTAISLEKTGRESENENENGHETGLKRRRKVVSPGIEKIRRLFEKDEKVNERDETDSREKEGNVRDRVRKIEREESMRECRTPIVRKPKPTIVTYQKARLKSEKCEKVKDMKSPNYRVNVTSRNDNLKEKNGGSREGGGQIIQNDRTKKNCPVKNGSPNPRRGQKWGKINEKCIDIRTFFTKQVDPKIESLRANFALKKGQTSRFV